MSLEEWRVVLSSVSQASVFYLDLKRIAEKPPRTVPSWSPLARGCFLQVNCCAHLTRMSTLKEKPEAPHLLQLLLPASFWDPILTF